MNVSQLKEWLTARLGGLSAAQLSQIENLIDGFESNIDEIRETLAWEKWQYLRDHHQERDNEEPLSNEEIGLVCSFLTKQNLSRPLEAEKQKVFIADDFNAPLPDDIIELFYS